MLGHRLTHHLTQNCSFLLLVYQSGLLLNTVELTVGMTATSIAFLATGDAYVMPQSLTEIKYIPVLTCP